jgi:hypothetical protein
VRGMATGVSAVRLPSSRMAAHQRHRLAGRHVTTTDTPTRARTSMPTPTLTVLRSSGGCRRTLRCGHAVARLPGGSNLRGTTSAPATEGAARGSGAQQAESSASRQRSERGRAGAPSAHGPNPPPSQHRERGEGERGEGGGAATSAVRSRLGPRASTTTVTTARATTTIVDVGGTTTATTTAIAASRRTKGVHGPLARASATRSSFRAFVLRPMYLGTTGTPTLACGSRTTDSPATPGERRTTSSSSRICRSTSATPSGHG